MSRVLQATCLKPKYSLRRQILVSFGVTCVAAIGVVMIIATLTAKSSGETVKSHARTALKQQVIKNLGASSNVVAETVSRKFSNFGSLASIIVEGTRDRFVGYPDDFANDSHVPFLDMTTGDMAYPLRLPPLPPEWNISGNVNSENYEEHVQERFSFYSLPLSTAHAHYFMQGVCDPQETDPTAKTFYQGCTPANNNFTTGGVLQPTSTNRFLAEKAADLAALLKPLYESHGDVKVMGMYFANSGAGSFVAYPSEVRDGTSSYTSIGCGWMSQTNNLTGLPLGTDEEIARCHQENTSVPSREYNPLERSWCKDQAMNPGRTRSVGPYLDAFTEGLWLITFGRAVFDRMTGNFLGCTLLDVSVSRVEEILDGVKIGGNTSDANIALIRWDDGTVVSSSQWNASKETETIFLSDLEVGITHSQIKSLVNFDVEWTPQQVQDAFTDNVFEHEGRLVSVCPIPVPPAEYDSNYSPDYIIVLSIGEEVFDVVDRTDEAIDDDVDTLIRDTLVIGFAGMLVVLVLIFVFSIFLTRPLSWMERVAWQIVNITETDSMEATEFNEDTMPLLRCTPRTEITYLVDEFRTMIHGFSGEGAAKVARASMHEVKNTIAWQPEFEHFYCSDVDEETVSSDGGSSSTENHAAASVNPTFCQRPMKGAHVVPPPRINIGPNLTSKAEDTMRDEQTKFYFRALVNTHKSVFSSPLFWWIVVLIVVPMVVTMAAICTVVILDITRVQPTWLEDVESSSIELEKEEIVTAAIARAQLTEEAMTEPIRDLHLFSRVAGWLLFGGIERSNSFTELDQGTEECKTFPPDGSCPFHLNRSRAPCDCAWNDSHGRECQEYPSGSRSLQRRFYAGQSQDADSNGSRNATSFPDTDFFPNTTKWWDNIESMPGSFKGANASGHETTYDRVRVLSAAAVVEFPIYNYVCTQTRKKHLGTYVGLEADGMMMGFNGCAYSFTEVSHFRSSKENGASTIRGDLCPENKYGYDCRCRDWYSQGRKRGLATDGSGVHITPPYIFASASVVAASATAALIDPVTGEHVGQSVIDFIPADIISTGTTESGLDFEIVVTPETDAFGGDTVVGPGYTLGSASPPIGDLVLPSDAKLSTNRQVFEQEVLPRMKAGESGSIKFKRAKEDGGDESIFIAFAPVELRTSRPIDPGNYARGVRVSPTLIYSLGIAAPESELIRPFTSIEDDVKSDIDAAATTLIVLIVVVSFLATLITCDVAISITGPVIILLGLVRNINAKKIRDDIPPMKGGSREVNQVYNSFAKLHKVVRFSNTAFFSGNLKWAYKFLNNALALFRKLEDKKAIGIAANNLGNTLVAMYKENSSTQGCCIVDNRCVWKIGRQCYDEAIQIGSEDYLNEPGHCASGHTRADYAEQLANRHFNRGLFFLLTRDDPCAFEDATERGYEDLLKAKCLDREARELRLEIGATHAHHSDYFDKILRRLRGLVEALEEDGAMDFLEIKDLIDEAEHVLFLAWNTSSPMFREISRIGRLQQLEDIVIQSELCKRNVGEAVRIGMRMLVEDDYVLELPFSSAAKALLMILRGASPVNALSRNASWTTGTISATTTDLRNMFRRCKTTSVDTGKNVFFCLGYGDESNADGMSKATENVVRIYDECCSDFDSVGLIPFNKAFDNNLKFPLARKGNSKDEQISILSKVLCVDASRKAEPDVGVKTMYAVLRHAVQLVLDTGEHDGNDTWILVLTDGDSVEGQHDQSVISWIAELNGRREAAINIILIGVELADSEVDICKEYCVVSRDSAYIDASGGASAIDKAFETVSRIISAGTINGGFIYGGVTMEKF